MRKVQATRHRLILICCQLSILLLTIVFREEGTTIHIGLHHMCSRLAFMFRHSDMSCTYTCIRMIRQGRWANNFFQLLRAVQLHKMIGFTRFKLPSPFLFLYDDFEVGPIHFELETTQKEECFTDRFWYTNAVKFPVEDTEVTQSLRELLNKALSVNDFLDDEVGLYMRSGDIFHRNPYFAYGQPPCGYYREIAESRPWKKLRIIAENTGNPCVDYMKARGAEWTPGNLTSDLRTLLMERHLAIAVGTFGWALFCMSLNLQTLYTFNLRFSRWDLPHHINCLPKKEYQDRLLKHWKWSYQQIELMKVHTCAMWEEWSFGERRERGIAWTPREDTFFTH